MGNIVKIHHLTPKWSTRIMEDPRKEPLCFASPQGDKWSVLLALPTNGPYPLTVSFTAAPGPYKGEMYKEGAMEHWGLIKIGPGTWKVDPSVQEDRYQLHAYIVLCEVPEPAPWEIPR